MNGMLLKLELAKPANYNEIQDSTNWLWRTSFDAGVFNGHKLKLLMITVLVLWLPSMMSVVRGGSVISKYV